MKQLEAKKLFIEYTSPQFEQWGFKVKKTRDINVIFIRRKENGYERIGVSTTNYYPEVVFEMGTSKRVNIVEDILYQINEEYALGLNVTNDETSTLSFWGYHYGRRRLKLLEVEHKDDERGVQNSAKILMDYLEYEDLPAYDLFDDLQELDRKINGEGENFWESDGTDKPFNLGTYFGYRRLIIARLCKSDEGFLDFVGKYYTWRDRNAERLGMPKIDNNDMSDKGNIVIKYLKENVSPIY